VRRDPRRVVLTIGGALSLASLALGLSALHLWPVVVTMRDASRIIGGAPGTKLVEAIAMVLKPHGKSEEDGTFFVGAFVLPAVILGLGSRRSAAPAIGLVLSVWMARGYAVRPSLFAAMRALPVYETLRYPERFFIFAALFGSVLAARGITSVHALVRSRTLRVRSPRGHTVAQVALVFGVLGLAIDVGPLVAQHVWHAVERQTVAPPSTASADRPFHQARGNRWALAYYEPMNRGSLSCYEAYPVPQSAMLRGNLPSEEYLLDPTAGSVAERRWSPNAIDVDASLVKATRLVVNQNFHTGWRSNVGQVVSEQGLLAVDLPEGEHHVRLTFSPRSARAGLVVTLISLAGLIAVLALRRFGARITAVIAIVPPAVAAAVFLHEPPSPPRDLRALDGSPVVVEQPPDGTRGVHVDFEAGVSLEAVALSDTNPIAGREILVEFDWKRAPDVERGLGVFVHIVPEGEGYAKNGDHVLLSGVVELDDAPPGKTLRDVLPITFPDRDKTYKIWVGLWRIRRDASRVRVVDKGSATIDENRVLVGRVTVR
jgi:hypothetical protein